MNKLNGLGDKMSAVASDKLTNNLLLASKEMVEQLDKSRFSFDDHKDFMLLCARSWLQGSIELFEEHKLNSLAC